MSFALIGCSTAKKTAKKPKMTIKMLQKAESTEFDVYINLFVAKFNKYAGGNMNAVNFKREQRLYMSNNMPDNILGLCYKPLGMLQIYINKKAWDKATSIEREMLMFHEFGHCGLGLGHDASRDEDGLPLSLMHPYDQDAELYVKYYDYYNQQLFELFIDAMNARNKARAQQREESSEEKARNKRKRIRRMYILRKGFFKKKK